MAYKLTGDVALLFIVWVFAFGFLSVLAILEGYYLISAVLILGLIMGALVLLHKSDIEAINKIGEDG